MKPWSGRATCRNYDHNAPNPYCSCGYYSIKKFAEVTTGSFGHDGSNDLLRHYDNLFARLNKQHTNEYEQKLIAELFFNSPVVKTLEIKNFALVGEVEAKTPWSWAHPWVRLFVPPRDWMWSWRWRNICCHFWWSLLPAARSTRASACRENVADFSALRIRACCILVMAV